jgi:Ca2+-binding RTX toxin-like protein
MVMALNGSGTVTLNEDGTGTVVTASNTVQLEGIESMLLWSYGGDVVFVGNSDNNDVTTGDGDDTLYGGGGIDFLYSGEGADTLDGGDGWDFLWGEGGADTFVFDHLGPGSQNQTDSILDFTPGVDKIDLSNTGVQDFNDLFTPGDRFMEQAGSHVVIHTSVDNETGIWLYNVQMDSLTASDFLF